MSEKRNDMPVKTTQNQIIRNVFVNWSYYLISMLTGFLLMPFMVHHLGDTVYGIWILILSLTGYMGFFDLGIRSAIVKYAAGYRVKGEQDELNKLVSTSFFSYLALGIFVLFITGFIALNFDVFFHMSNSFSSSARAAFIIVGLNIALTLPLSVFGGVIWGFQRFDIFSIVETVSLILKTVLIILFIIQGFGLVALGIITILSNLLGQFIRIWYAYHLNPKLKIKFKFINRKSLKEIFGYGIPVFIVSVADRLKFYTDAVIVGKLIGFSSVTFYSIGARLINYIKQIVAAMTDILIPTTSELNAVGEKEKIKKLFILGTRYSMILILPIGIVLIIFGKPLIEFWMGEKYVSLSLTVLIILTLAQVFGIYRHICKVILQGKGMLEFLTWLSMVEVVIGIILSILFAKCYGIIGVAIGSSVPFVIANGVILPVYLCRTINISLDEYVKKAVAFPLFCSVFIILMAVVFIKNLYPYAFIILGIEVFICLATYWIIFFYFSKNGSDKELCNKFRKKIKTGLLGWKEIK